MRFNNLDDDRDFPYYNKNPPLSKTAWVVLLLSIPIALYLYGTIPSEFVGSIAFCFVMMVPLLYFSSWDYSLFLRKPAKDEITFAVLMFIGYIIYSIVVGSVLEIISRHQQCLQR